MPTIRVGEQQGLFTCPSGAHTAEQQAAGRCTCRERECGHIAADGNTCSNCESCANCCECFYCDRCNNRVTDYCDDCERCTNCCRCHSDGEIPFCAGSLRFFPSALDQPGKPGVPKANELKDNPLKRHISVELEVDHFDPDSGGVLRSAVTKWHDAVVHDGSLSSGFEVNTNPSAGDYLVKHLKDYADAFQRMGPARAGIDCGMHTHVNAKDFRQYDLRKLILLYRSLERGLFDACEHRRLNNRYALLCGQFYLTNDKKPKDFRANLNYKLYPTEGYVNVRQRPRVRERMNPRTGRIEQITLRQRPQPPRPSRRDLIVPSPEAGHYIHNQKASKYYSMRYKALNLHSWFYRGTVEFRHKEGLTKFDDMLGWARVAGTVVDQALKLSEKDIQALPRNSREALLHIMPTDLQSWLKDTWTKFDRTASERQRQYKREIWANQGRTPGDNPDEF